MNPLTDRPSSQCDTMSTREVLTRDGRHETPRGEVEAVPGERPVDEVASMARVAFGGRGSEPTAASDG